MTSSRVVELKTPPAKACSSVAATLETYMIPIEPSREKNLPTGESRLEEVDELTQGENEIGSEDR